MDCKERDVTVRAGQVGSVRENPRQVSPEHAQKHGKNIKKSSSAVGEKTRSFPGHVSQGLLLGRNVVVLDRKGRKAT